MLRLILRSPPFAPPPGLIRDAERMKRELQSVERDIGESEIERNKCWDLDAFIGTKLKELEALQIECNQDIRRLKLGHDIQYQLNVEGLTDAEVLGMDYKSTLKPILSSFSDEVKRTYMENLENLMSLQKLARDIATKIDAKRNRIAMLQSRIDEVETQLNSIKDETLHFTSTCATEARQLVENFEAESHNVDVVEKEARELVEVLQERGESTSRNGKRVTKMVNEGTRKTTLAIGDGANDVGMLQEADIGVGISGAEEMQVFFLLLHAFILKNPAPAVYGRWGSVAIPLALILSPTRELCCQIFEEATKFCYQTGAVAYGGAPIHQQLREHLKRVWTS